MPRSQPQVRPRSGRIRRGQEDLHTRPGLQADCRAVRQCGQVNLDPAIPPSAGSGEVNAYRRRQRISAQGHRSIPLCAASPGHSAFAAVVVLDGEEIGCGTNRVVELLDPSAHAEIMALRDAAKKVRKYLLPGSVLYSSCEPCPMCLAACYWARVSRIVFGASSSQAAEHGFQDLDFYRELAVAPGQRSIPEISASDPLRAEAAAVLKRWPPSKPLSVV